MFDGSDYLITYSGLSYGVFAGQCYCSNSVPFDLDDVNAPSGKYYVLIIADDLGKVAETNENNNLINGGTVDYQGGGSNPTAITNNIFDNNKTQLKNYPNPFYSTTYFKFKIIQDEHVTLTIIDVLGKEVAQLVDRHLTTGEYVFPFDASHLPAGVYYYKATTNNTIQTRKVMIIR